MADNFYDATGILILDKVTPIIQALFGGMKLDADYPGNGQAYIARIFEGGDALWDDIRDNLDELADGLGLPPTSDAESGIQAVLHRWAAHFGVESHEGLSQLIEHHDFAGSADLEALFVIATCFEDGHGLKAIVLVAAWYCSKPRLFSFGGEGMFISREVMVYGSSSSVRELGHELRNALVAGRLEDAADTLASEVSDLLAGIGDAAVRRLLQEKLAHKLLEQCVSSGSASSDARV